MNIWKYDTWIYMIYGMWNRRCDISHEYDVMMIFMI